MSGGRAHWGGLEAAGELHAFCGKLVEMGGLGLPPVDFHVQVGAVIGDHEHDVGRRSMAVQDQGEKEEERTHGVRVPMMRNGRQVLDVTTVVY